MKKIVLILLIAILLVVFYGLFLFNKKIESLEAVPPDYIITSDELFTDFNINEEEALKKYEGKVIQVTGEVMAITKTDSISNVILSAKDAIFGGVNCSFTRLDESWKKDDTVTLKGQCQGFLTSVVLNNCTAIK